MNSRQSHLHNQLYTKINDIDERWYSRSISFACSEACPTAIVLTSIDIGQLAPPFHIMQQLSDSN